MHSPTTPWGGSTVLQHHGVDSRNYNTYGVDSRAITPMGWIHILQHQWVGFTELQHRGVDSWSYSIMGWIRGATTPRGGILTKASES